MDAEELLAIREALDNFDWSVFGDLEEPKPDYTNSCPFNINLCSADAHFDDAVQHLCNEIGYDLDRAVMHMGMVISNLYKTYMLDPDRWVGYLPAW